MASSLICLDSELSVLPHVAGWAQEAWWGPWSYQTRLQTRGCLQPSDPSQTIPVVQLHIKTCLKGSGQEARDCKLLAERNGCLDTGLKSKSRLEVNPHV